MSSRKSVLFAGLQAQSLGGYMSALGVLRVCSELAAGCSIRCRWLEHGFELSGLSESEVISLIAKHYCPTPIVSPWAGGSGFAEGEDAAALNQIRTSADPRLSAYRGVIEKVLSFPELPPRGLSIGDVVRWGNAKVADAATPRKLRAQLGELLEAVERKNEPNSLPVDVCGAGHPAAKIFTQMKSAQRVLTKSAIAARCRNELPEECLGWIDASVVLFVDKDGEIEQINGALAKDAMKPRLEFSRLFMEATCATICATDPSVTDHWLRSFLKGGHASGLPRSAAGLFEQASAGGSNSGPGFEHKNLPNNPWRTLMTFEGASVWCGAVSRRAGSSAANVNALSPFTASHVAVGAGNVAEADRKPGAIEVWTPLWSKPATFAEVTNLIGEGRARIDRRQPHNGIEFAEALASLGVDRGISSFVRFAVTERRGPSYIATPLGRYNVRSVPQARFLGQLGRELRVVDDFLARFRGEGPPALLVGLRRAIDEARFDVAVRGGEASMIRLVRAIGAFEMVLAKRDPSKDPKLPRPLGGLTTDWIDACGDSVEVRIAAALASIAATGAVGGIRGYLAPLDEKNAARYAPSARACAWVGANLSDRLSHLLQRRLLDARSRGGQPGQRSGNPTWGVCTASLDDVAAFLAPGMVDDAALEELLFGFTWLKYTARTNTPLPPATSPPLPRVYALLKLLLLPHPLQRDPETISLAPDAALLPLLRAGRIPAAVELASRQLVAKSLCPRRVLERQAEDNGAFGRRIAAALLIPVRQTNHLVEAALLRRPDTDSNNIDSEEMTHVR